MHVYKEMDPCWIYAGETSEGKPCLERGTVVGAFKAPGMPQLYYIIRLHNAEWEHFEVRDALLMSPSADQLPPFVKRSPDNTPIGSLAAAFGDEFDDDEVVIEEA